MDRLYNWLDFFAATGPSVRVGIVYLIALCCLTGGLILLLWGRPLRRITMAGICGAVAAAIAPFLPPIPSLPLWAMQLIAAALGAGIGALLAALLWAILASAGFVASTACILLLIYYPEPSDAFAEPLRAAAGTDLPAWLGALGESSWLSLQTLGGEHTGVFFAAACGVGVAALVIFTIKMSWAVILLSASIGAKAMTAGGVMILLQIRPGLWHGIRQRYWIPTAVATALALVGLIYQGLHARRAGLKAESEEPGEPPQKAPARPGESREDKKGRKKKSENAE
jgi:hypothetical protein